MKKVAKWLKVTGVVLLSAGGAVVWILQMFGTPVVTPSTSNLDILHARCVQEMVTNTCKVMGTGRTAITAKPGDLVFVAGVGSISAVAYQQMYAAGDAMCSVIREACAKQWNGGQCKTARQLFIPSQRN
jgi:hypothetical protein